MLKAVENPTGDIAQGIMVTPEGGYVVAQPDLYVFRLMHHYFLISLFLIKGVMAKASFLTRQRLNCGRSSR